MEPASQQMQRCLPSYIKAESRAGRMGQELIAVAAEGDRGRQYCPPTTSDTAAADSGAATVEARGGAPRTRGSAFVCNRMA